MLMKKLTEFYIMEKLFLLAIETFYYLYWTTHSTFIILYIVSYQQLMFDLVSSEGFSIWSWETKSECL
jgi:hypothetical protein